MPALRASLEVNPRYKVFRGLDCGIFRIAGQLLAFVDGTDCRLFDALTLDNDLLPSNASWEIYVLVLQNIDLFDLLTFQRQSIVHRNLECREIQPTWQEFKLLRGSRQRTTGSIHLHDEAFGKFCYFPGEVGILLAGFDGSIPVQVHQRLLLKGRDLRHVDKVEEIDALGSKCESTVVADGEIPHRV